MTITVEVNKATIDSGDGNKLLKEVNAYLNKQKLTHKEALSLLNNYINKNGLKQSAERLKVLEIIFNQNNEFTVNNIYDNIPIGTSIAKTTIYNIINLFIISKIVRKKRIGNEKINCPNGMVSFFEINTK